MVKVDVVADADDLIPGVAAAVVVVLALANFVFNDDYVDTGDFVVFVVVTVDNADVSAVAHVDGKYLKNIRKNIFACLFSVHNIISLSLSLLLKVVAQT